MSDQTFLFADLAGFTALTEHHGDTEAAELAVGFGDACRQLLGDYGATEIKTIGDAMLVRVENPASAIELGVCITTELGERHGYPMIRVGMHTGSAVERGGDWFGAAVNLAARVSGEASGSQVLLTEQTSRAAGPLEGIELQERGRRPLRNVMEPVVLFEAVRQGTPGEAGLPVDPVCRMAVDPEYEAGNLRHGPSVFHFCSLVCAGAFAAEPGRYAGEDPG